jgi:oligoribonuclease NrnB/cAMP/cGMP phosphodiesterase (DHH superfamily)
MNHNPQIIVYHNNCPDGFTAAYVAKLRYPFAQLVGLDHGLSEEYITSLISGCAETDVLMVDFSFRTREQNDMLAKSALSLRILDHHKTAQKVLEGAPYAVFDMERSGAGLAWDYLFGKDSPYSEMQHAERPWYVDYVEDRDLWRFKLPMSREVNAYIMTFPYDIAGWDKMAKSGFMYAATAGEAVILQIEKYVREAVKQAQPGKLGHAGRLYTVGIVNIPYLNTSEVVDALAHRYDIGLGWFERADGVIQFSARSLKTNDVDVSAIAQAFGGGGHRTAAGWQVPVDKGREIIDTILGRNKA